ncbi:DEAD/DEAH box helicase [Nocardioides alcanivorans]|uniref:DEAD/DEAH box helicase n=1 Tax=Nocardioides alcanivorans TaxID=2897352 RepID=UPI001F387017|nr:DEAD/DEAH box helicase [Nocardioides alcanivorans]
MDFELLGSELLRVEADSQRSHLSWADVARLVTSEEIPADMLSRASRKAASVRIHLTGDSLDNLAINVEAQFGARARQIRLGQEHVILGAACHPLQPEAVASAFEALNAAALTIGKLSLGQYQELIVGFPAFELLVDDVHLDPTLEAERATSEVAPAAIVDATLYPYQVAGSAFIRSMAGHGVGTLIADEMGLGKTLQAITLLAERKSSGISLVVAPAALLLNWGRELSRFTPHIRWLLHAGSSRVGVAGSFSPYDVVITSYETLSNDLTFMGDHPWDIVIIDEAQAIKNPDSQRARAVKGLNRRVGIAITGTPVENGLADIWSIVEFVVPSVARCHGASVVGRERDLAEAERTGRAVAPVILRRRVAEVGSQLPSRIDKVVTFELTPAMRQRYEQITTVLGVGLPALQAQRQFCALGDTERSETEIHNEPKFVHLMELIEQLASCGEKALVFTSFTLSVDRLVERIRAIPGVNLVAAVDGRSSPTERQALIDQFGQVAGAAVLVMNPKAAGVGLNITAANHVFHFNPEWNPAATDQGTARAHRTGQHRTVFVHEFYYAGTVEEDAVLRAEHKRDVADAVEAGVRQADRSALTEGTTP